MSKRTDPQPLPFPGEPGGLPFQVVTKAPWGANWPAWDVPRLADILAPEDNAVSGEQANGFRRLSDLLHDHYRSLIRQRGELAAAWQGPAAEVVLQHIDKFTAQLLSDARCAAVTSSALYGIISTHAKAKADIAALHDQWKDVTTDWAPEWWDHAAEELNTKAVAIMDQTDKALGDHRTHITVPESHYVERFDSTPLKPQTSVTTTTTQPRQTQSRYVPPLPGYEPVTGTSDTAGMNGPELSGAPTSVPATPGQPVSMLPVPPGNPYAPFGGAYILPGPGVGKGGYVVQMPQPSRSVPGTTGVMGSGAAGRAGPAGAIGGGIMPLPMTGGANPAAGGRAGHKNGGRSDTIWEVETGVPPVIEGISEQAFIQGRPSTRQETDFQDWFAQLAYPWRKDQGSQGQEPQVILRRTTP